MQAIAHCSMLHMRIITRYSAEQAIDEAASSRSAANVNGIGGHQPSGARRMSASGAARFATAVSDKWCIDMRFWALQQSIARTKSKVQPLSTLLTAAPYGQGCSVDVEPGRCAPCSRWRGAAAAEGPGDGSGHDIRISGRHDLSIWLEGAVSVHPVSLASHLAS